MDQEHDISFYLLCRSPFGVIQKTVNKYGEACFNGFKGTFKEYLLSLDSNDLPIECLGLTCRILAALEKNDINYIRDIKSQAFALVNIKGLGKQAINEILGKIKLVENQ